MLYRAKDIVGSAVRAVNGEVGVVRDLYFDDATWFLRYFVVDTGGWLTTNEVLLVPWALRGDPTNQSFASSLTREQIENSPPVASALPVARQQEQMLHEYYSWVPYWGGTFPAEPGFFVYPPLSSIEPGIYPEVLSPGSSTSMASSGPGLKDNTPAANNPHLRSFKEVRGYHVQATDGQIGRVACALVDPASWRFTHLVVAIRHGLSVQHFVVDVGFTKGFDWESGTVKIDLMREQVRKSPDFVPGQTIDDTYQRVVSSYYRGLVSRFTEGRPRA